MVLLGELPVVLYYSEGLKESARKMCLFYQFGKVN